MEDVAEHPVEVKQLESRLLQYGDILLEKSGGGPTQPVGRVALFNIPNGEYSYSNFTARIRVVDERANGFFVWLVLNHFYQSGKTEGLQKQTSGIRNLDNTAYLAFQIPLPPLEVQKEIVAEIEGYQKVIDGARAVVDNYRPHISIHPDWPSKELGEVCRLGRGFAFKSEDYVREGILSFRVSNIGKDRLPNLENSVYLPKDFLKQYAEYQLQEGDFVIVMVGATTGKIGYITGDVLPALLNQNMWRFHPDESVLNKRFLYYAIDQLPLFRQGGARDYLKQSDFLKNSVPLPSLATQQAIVAEIEAEQALVAANRELMARFEQKIQATLARVWGEEEPAAPEA